MTKDDKSWKKELEDIDNEILISKVSSAIKKDPQNWKNSMEEIGFTWVDDGAEEVEERRNAVAENANQEYLLAYLEGTINFNEHLIEAYNKEMESENFNYPLFVSFFEAGNDSLLHPLSAPDGMIVSRRRREICQSEVRDSARGRLKFYPE